MRRVVILPSIIALAACGADNMEEPDGGTLDDEAVVTAPAEPVPPPTDEALIDVIEADGRFTILAEALRATRLDEDLSGGGYTLFAPTDEAFAALGQEAQTALMDPANRSALRRLLRYHAAADARTAAQIEGAALRTLSGQTLRVERSGERLLVGDTAVVTQADTQAGGSVLHAVDAVLLPPDAD